mgnify:CR=1 FL=1
MRAYHLTSLDTPPQLTTLSPPPPAAGEVCVKIAACGLNFADLLMMKGQYQDMPQLPFTLGMEVAGTICAQAADGAGPGIGTRVAVFGGAGGLAEYGVFDAARVIRIPDKMSFIDAAAFQIAYGTSHLALDHKARLRPGETLLVLGAAGGVGLTAVEIGKAMGARVIACARGAEKLEAARRAGADHLIDASHEDIREACLAIGGLDVVYDPVGGDQFTAAMRACNPEARILSIGFASGDVPQIKANHLLVKNISVMGFYWGGYLKFRPDLLTRSLATLLEWYEARRIQPHVSHTYPLAEAGTALELLRSRQSTGKVVVTMT